jgi:DNA mismatch repair protein MutL
MPIKVLDPKVVARIAAGEVVERPASAVKELVENALDAGATQIAIEVGGGGISLIRVMDNGSGIPAAEVALAFERYATSKISGLEDLDSIASLGFRGEALPSIAAVADVELVTHAEGESGGSYLSLSHGSIVEQHRQGRAQGTTVAVRGLFRQVPARLKFLKSPATESSHIAQVVSQYALAFPEVKFDLLIDGRAVLRTPGSGKLRDSAVAVYGSEVARNMLEIKSGEGNWQGNTSPKIVVTGLVGVPSISRASRSYLSFFVNRRWINSRLLAWAVEEAYHGLLMQGKHPIAIINVALPPPEVDVNIHPTKTEVKFRDEHAVFSAVQRAVRRALVEQAPVPMIEEVAVAYEAPPTTQSKMWSSPGVEKAISPLPAVQTARVALPVLRVVGQLWNSYIIAEGPDELYLIDQHAAHERVLFEKVKEQWSRREIEVQGLLEPATLEVTPQQEEVLKSHYQDLADFGFSLEPFGNRTYLVRSVPLLLYQKDWAAVIRELTDSPAGRDEGDWREKAMVSIACHSAVRAGQALTMEEMRELVRQLEEVAVPQTCPHGRPTLLQLSQERLRKEFGRI